MMEHESLVQLYRDVFPEAGRLIKRLGGNLEEAKDAFHDALLIYLEREAKGTLQIHTSAKAYLLGTVKILWLHSKNKYFNSLPEDVEAFVDEENEAVESENIFRYLLLAGQKVGWHNNFLFTRIRPMASCMFFSMSIFKASGKKLSF